MTKMIVKANPYCNHQNITDMNNLLPNSDKITLKFLILCVQSQAMLG